MPGAGADTRPMALTETNPGTGAQAAEIRSATHILVVASCAGAAVGTQEEPPGATCMAQATAIAASCAT